MEFISNVAAVFEKHIGRYPKLPTDTVSEAVQCSPDTVGRWRSGESRPDDWALFMLAKHIGKHRPEFITELMGAMLCNTGWKVVRDENFSRDELDANHDGKVDRTDAAIHQAEASKGSADKMSMIVSGDNFDALCRIDPLVQSASEKASTVMKLVGA